MVKKFTYKHLTWLDLSAPSKEEVLQVADEYKIHPVVTNELIHPSQRSKVDLYDNFIYLILHFPTDNFFKSNNGEKNVQEIDFIIGQDFLITTHYEPVQTLEEFGQIFEASTAFTNRRAKDLHAGFVFYYLLRQLYQSLDPGLDALNSSLKRAEEKVFSGQEAEMVKTLSAMNRSLLDLKWSLKTHKTVLESLEIAGRDFFDDKFGHYLEAVNGEYERIWNLLEETTTTFSEIKDTNESLLAIKNNDTMKVLTVLAFLFLPISFMAAVFGMSGNENMPLIKSENGFYSVISLMALVAILMVLLVKYKKWL